MAMKVDGGWGSTKPLPQGLDLASLARGLQDGDTASLENDRVSVETTLGTVTQAVEDIQQRNFPRIVDIIKAKLGLKVFIDTLSYTIDITSFGDFGVKDIIGNLKNTGKDTQLNPTQFPLILSYIHHLRSIGIHTSIQLSESVKQYAFDTRNAEIFKLCGMLLDRWDEFFEIQ